MVYSMTSQTKAELKRCLDYLRAPDVNDPDHSQGIEGAIRGLNDWFCQSLFDEGLLSVEIIDDFEGKF